MKRDMDLIRKILVATEEQDEGRGVDSLNIEEYKMEEIAYHCKLLWEDKYILSYNPYYTGEGLEYFSIGSLTWKGHEFLDEIRSDTV